MASSPFSRHTPLASIAGTLLSLFALSCATGIPPGGTLAGPRLTGHLHGGQQPIAGAAIQLYSAGTSGYGQGATPLLSPAAVTDANGNFSTSTSYVCPSSSTELYLVATGGNPGLAPGTNNPGMAMMAALGSCKLVGNQYLPDPAAFVNIDEVTTVASVYALSAFMDPATGQIGASGNNAVGIANAFATVNNLVDISTGQARSVTPAGNGTVPLARINSLADILAPCVNSNGSGTACNALFAAATPAGGATPTNTLQATLNIAQHPSAEVLALFNQGSTMAPFQPTLPAPPSDWTLAINYTGGGLANSVSLDIDASGNIWVANNGLTSNAGSIIELSNAGAILSGPSGFTAPGGVGNPSGIAIDPAGNAWLASASVFKFSSTGALVSGPAGFTAPSLNGPRAVAIDGVGNAWVPSFSSGSPIPANVVKFANDGTVLSPGGGFTAPGLTSPLALAIDASGDAWVTSQANGSVTKFSSTGEILSGNGYTGGTNFFSPGPIAIDNAGNAWISDVLSPQVVKISSTGTPLSDASGFRTCVESPQNTPPPTLECSSFSGGPVAIDGAGNAWLRYTYRTVTANFHRTDFFALQEMASDGTVLSGLYGYNADPSFLATGIAIDSSGNLWATSSFGRVLELVGAATPVTTPLSVAVRDHKLATRP